MSKGDILARGGKQATFQGARMQTELESDLKIYGRDFVLAKYDITLGFYDGLVEKLKRGEQLPEVMTAAEKARVTGHAEPGLQPVAEEVFDKVTIVDRLPIREAPDPVFMPAVGPVPIPDPEALGMVKEWRERPSTGYEGDPVGDNVLVQRVEREHTSNLILPDSLKAKSDIGFIKAVGEAVKYFKAGDLVLFDKFASHGSDISLIDEDGVERAMLLLREFDILIRLKKVALK